MLPVIKTLKYPCVSVDVKVNGHKMEQKEKGGIERNAIENEKKRRSETRKEFKSVEDKA